MEVLNYRVANKLVWQEKALQYLDKFNHVVFINSNDETENLIAVSDLLKIRNGDWQFGFISYDYKNQIEQKNVYLLQLIYVFIMKLIKCTLRYILSNCRH